MITSHMSTAQAASLLEADLSTVRRIIDQLAPDCPRFRGYRLVPPEMLPRIRAELVRRGLAKPEEASVA